MQKNPYDIAIFLIVVGVLIITMVIFIISIVLLYGKKQKTYGENIEALKMHYEKVLLTTKLEIQEQTFLHISREIHDNINMSLTLAKLNLNTIKIDEDDRLFIKINSTINLITQSISELSNISKGLNSDLITQQSLVQAVQEELNRIHQASALVVTYQITGNPVYLNSQKELIIFRIIQEAFNNIIKHSKSKTSILILDYEIRTLNICIIDDGIGFDKVQLNSRDHAGLRNMETRTKILGGSMEILSEIGKGTTLNFQIPFEINGNE